MILDASPYGYGGVLVINGVVVAYFADTISRHDVRIMQTEAGKAEGQQTWEALCLLIAMRIWSAHWMTRRSILCVKSDNKAALTLVAKLKAKRLPRYYCQGFGIAIRRVIIRAQAR